MYELTMDPSKMNGMLTLKESVTIQNASELRGTLIYALDEVNTLYVTHHEITECDATYLQLLIAANKSALEMKKSFKVIGHHSDAFLKLMSLSGCTSFDWIEEDILLNAKSEGEND
jgi:anti-anti-sigma regulatory factor